MKEKKTTTTGFCKIGGGTQLKNDLQKDFQLFLQERDGLLTEDIAKEIELITSTAQQLNEKHKRCKALYIVFYETTGFYALQGFLTSFYIYKVKDFVNY